MSSGEDSEAAPGGGGADRCAAHAGFGPEVLEVLADRDAQMLDHFRRLRHAILGRLSQARHAARKLETIVEAADPEAARRGKAHVEDIVHSLSDIEWTLDRMTQSTVAVAGDPRLLLLRRAAKHEPAVWIPLHHLLRAASYMYLPAPRTLDMDLAPAEMFGHPTILDELFNSVLTGIAGRLEGEGALVVTARARPRGVRLELRYPGAARKQSSDVSAFDPDFVAGQDGTPLAPLYVARQACELHDMGISLTRDGPAHAGGAVHLLTIDIPEGRFRYSEAADG